MERIWHDGFTTAAHQLGKVWRDGLCDPPDEKQAAKWFRRAAEAGLDYSQYALGKLLQGQKRISEAVSWYEKAAAQGSQYAHYRLGKLYLAGDGVPKDMERAVEHLTASAKLGNQYAQDALGNHANTWVDYWSCAAYANLASGKEYGAAGQTLGSDTLVFEVRWCERLRDLDSTIAILRACLGSLAE